MCLLNSAGKARTRALSLIITCSKIKKFEKLGVFRLWEQLGQAIGWHVVCLDPFDVDAGCSRGWIWSVKGLAEPMLLDIDVFELGYHEGLLVVNYSHRL
jgi:hypothetical protein